MAGLKMITPPAVEPFNVAFVKQFLRIDSGDCGQDAYLTHLIAVSRENAEIHTARGFIFQTLREYYDGFPGQFWPLGFGAGLAIPLASGLLHPSYPRRRHDAFELSRSPLVQVMQLQYLDPTGATQTLDPSLYQVSPAGDPASIYRAPATCWPVAQCEPNSVWIDYKVGYSVDGTMIPKTAIQAMLFGISHWYENRDLLQSKDQVEMPLTMTNLLNKNKVYYTP